MSTPTTPFYPATHDDMLALIAALNALAPGLATSQQQGFMAPKPYINGGVIGDADDEIEGLMTPALVKAIMELQAIPHNYAYDGRNLKEIFDTAADFAAAVRAGDFSKIRVGDYWPLTLSGTFKDYATNETKTLSSAVFKMEVGSINPYWKYGDSGDLTSGIPHVGLISRDLLPFNIQFRSANTTWYDSNADNPWLGSHLYQSLNNPSDGLIKIVTASELGAYIYAGPNAKGMRHLMETKGPSATTATGWGWKDRGKLILLHEKEIWGNVTWAEIAYSIGATGGALQWDIFRGSRRHIVKGLGDGGSRDNWWCECSRAGNSGDICDTNSYGFPSNIGAAATWISVPLCFLLA